MRITVNFKWDGRRIKYIFVEWIAYTTNYLSTVIAKKKEYGGILKENIERTLKTLCHLA